MTLDEVAEDEDNIESDYTGTRPQLFDMMTKDVCCRASDTFDKMTLSLCAFVFSADETLKGVRKPHPHTALTRTLASREQNKTGHFHDVSDG